jgi:hypothetical protein
VLYGRDSCCAAEEAYFHLLRLLPLLLPPPLLLLSLRFRLLRQAAHLFVHGMPQPTAGPDV